VAQALAHAPTGNLVSKKPYRGINIFLLALAGYGSQYWLTYRQALALGGNVRRGEHGTKIVFFGSSTSTRRRRRTARRRSALRHSSATTRYST
jgi:antirestriction protein ArdC